MVHSHTSHWSLLYFRQKLYRLETLVQSSSHDFGEFVQYVIRSPAYNQYF